MNAEPKPTRQKVAVTLMALSIALVVASFAWRFATGRGSILSYLVPLAIVGHLIGVHLLRKPPQS